MKHLHKAEEDEKERREKGDSEKWEEWGMRTGKRIREREDKRGLERGQEKGPDRLRG